MNSDRRAVVLGPKVSGEEKARAITDALVFGHTGLEEVVIDGGTQEQQPANFEQQVQSLREAVYRNNLDKVTKNR